MYNNQTNIQNPQTFVKTNNIIHTALLAGLIFFGVVAFINAKNVALNLKPGNDIFFYVVPSLIIIAGLAGVYLFSQQLQRAKNAASLSEKLSLYQAAFISRAALTEGPSLFGIVCFMITGNLFYLLLVGVNVVYFITQKPTKSKIEDDLELSYEDKIML